MGKSPLPRCILCGGVIDEAKNSASWMSGFRVVYSLDKASVSASLSGPGKRLSSGDMIPIISSEGQKIDVYIDLNPSHFHFGRCSTAPPFGEETSAWGFPLHCYCWEILKESSPRKDVHVQSLFDLCRSFPLVAGIPALDFGHSYGGLFRREYLGIYPPFPGEEPRLALEKHSPVFQAHTFDPLDLSFLVKMVADRGRSAACHEPPTSIHTTITTHEPFTKLPAEILQLIFLYLSSDDILNLKLSSRVIAVSPLSDRFWHSRFCHGREFHHVFEFAQYSTHRGQWQMVFSSTWLLRHHPSLVNRKRIWHFATALQDLMAKTGSCQGGPFRSLFEQDAPQNQKIWVTADRGQQSCPPFYFASPKSLFERFITLPEMLSSISISVVDLFAGRYISGLRVADKNGNHWNLGYFQPHSSVSFTTTHIIGFLLAQDQRGIRGMRVLGEGGLTSEWIGDYQGIPRRRLILPRNKQSDENCIKYIKGGFNTCKMTTLAISNEAGSTDSADGLDHALPLQDTVTWFPDIPPSDISLFGLPSKIERDGAPFQTAMFGDLTGSHLPHVTGIKLWTDEGRYIKSLQIDLDEPLYGETTVYLGANENILRPMRRDRVLEEHCFLINSLEGERIIGLDINYSGGYFIDFEFHTSFNRSAQLPPPVAGSDYDRKRDNEFNCTRLWPEDGCIVGFYGIPQFVTSVRFDTTREEPEMLGIVCAGTTALKQFSSQPSDETKNEG